ncbi:Gfo/Idh/MocA family protein [Rhodopirellula sallentina]|uniref:Oxidoreductase domain-containing protein n=1 Tax=Rhodopirellula sallentina SM41 TaxID=1263870 RepID=M5UEI3_9BACT|nr:Gfo/Idh/MocA family oxidoreductase [Rhodopirellula sallentina]EMI56251.1 oxidoreductase domain-containing protein [Rhodopirellula sallentina SM41]
MPTDSNFNEAVSARPNRRNVLRAITGAAMAAGVHGSLPAAASNSPNEKLKVLIVGTANRAAANIAGVQSQDIVGLCDVDQNYLERVSATFPGATKYRDYREMISSEADKADAIVVSTADHHHAPATIRAIRAGLHCYCEKPLTHTIEEARIIATAAKKAGVVTQMGTQIHAEDNYRRVVEIVQSGAIGDVNEVHVWVGKGWGGGELPEKADPPPAHLDWDLWLGPAPERPYAAGRYHPAQWRRWWQFGQGTLGDMGCHYMDLPFWALKLRHPISCEAEGPEVHPETCPLGLTVRYKFPSRDEMPPVDLTWYDGSMTPKKVAGQRVPGSGVMFVGSEGSLFASYTNYKLFPKEKFADFTPPEETIPNSIGHYAEWIKACKEGTPTTCNFDYSGALSESVLLGNVAFRTGKKLDWDGENLRATNCPEADAFLRKEYREGWEVTA